MKTLNSQKLSLLLFAVIALLPLKASGQTVVSRARTGGYAEDIAFVTSGPLKNQVVMINGNELYSAMVGKKDALNKVCKLDHPEWDQFVNGFTFVESEGLFVMNNAPHPNKLYFFDQNCVSKGTRPIQYLNSSYRPQHLEGMAYIPTSSPLFPDHLILVAWDDLNLSAMRLVIMRRDGVQVAEISRSDWPTQFFEGGLGDVTFLAPNRLLVSLYHPDSLWIMDFNGTILSGPLPIGGEMGLGEGVVQTSDGGLVASSYPQSLIVFDKNLNRQPQNDRHDTIGLNLNLPHGIAWDSDADRFLVLHDTVVTLGPAGIAGLATTLASAAPVIDLSAFPFTRSTVYLPQEDLVATLRFVSANQRAILLFNLDGTLNSQISLSPASLGQNLGQPQGLTYLPGTDEFVVTFSGVPPNQGLERQRLRVFSRGGALVRTIDVSATGTGGIGGIEYFEDPQGGGGRFMMLSAAGRVLITDLNGNSRNADGFLLGEFNNRVKLGLITRSDLAAITSGPLAGAFAITDGSGGEVVIFRLDN
jgi:hypothetical protein